ncbi:unnamed protein product [Moneuplotes crassus]|uniref:Uncharacterized protein n=1 Tax=Euplotes crassus TaxID=5936 RepID=A0AAD1U4X9_EUPCR|nr:unnamed protein product [Moneuplotes crassus]
MDKPKLSPSKIILSFKIQNHKGSIHPCHSSHLCGCAHTGRPLSTLHKQKTMACRQKAPKGPPKAPIEQQKLRQAKLKLEQERLQKERLKQQHQKDLDQEKARIQHERKRQKKQKAKQEEQKRDAVFASVFRMEQKENFVLKSEDPSRDFGKISKDDRNGYYRVLRVGKEAKKEEILASYRKFVLFMHPDKGGSSDKFQYLTEARKVLEDERKRMVYDRFGRKKLQASLKLANDYEFQELVRKAQRGSRVKVSMNKAANSFTNVERSYNILYPLSELKKDIAPVKLSIAVSLSEVYKGSSKYIDHSLITPCETCHGKGLEPKYIQRCNYCEGKGEISEPNYFNCAFKSRNSRCEQCRGMGEIVIQEIKCNTCKGKRTKTLELPIRIEIPKGIHTGDRIELLKSGNEFISGFRGDLIIELRVKDEKGYKRNGDDLEYTKKISIEQAFCGTQFEIESLTSGKIMLKNEPGEIIKQEEYVMRGLGMPKYKTQNEFGDLIVKIKLKLPSKISESDVVKARKFFQCFPSEKPLIKTQDSLKLKKQKKRSNSAPRPLPSLKKKPNRKIYLYQTQVVFLNKPEKSKRPHSNPRKS